MWFIIIVAVIAIAVYIANKSSETKRQRLHKEIANIKKTYPHAFTEYVLKNHVSIGSAKNSVLEEITTRPSHIWKNEEQSLIEKEKRIQTNTKKILQYNEIANRKREEEERRKRQEEETKRRREQEEARRKAELAKYKPDREEIIRILRNNGIQCFYHFTARENLSSIKKYGGLYSWYSMQEDNRNIPCSGGDDWSHQLDMRHGLQDYVRLSFCNDHPMAYRLMQSGTPLVLLKIDIDVATWKDTQFSDINAADNNHRHGGNFSDLNRVNFRAVKRNYVSRDDDDFKPHQAEVMVKTFIPNKFILNLDSPISL